MSISFSSVLGAVYQYNRLQQANGAIAERLAAGKRYASPSDDPHMYNRISRFEADIARFDTYLQHMDEGLSVVSIASDAVTLQMETLERMLELAEKAGAGGTSASERAAYNEEYQKLLEELDTIAGNATFNGQSLLDGTYGEEGEGFLVSTGPGESFEIVFGNTTTGNDGLDLDGTQLTSAGQANSAAAKAEEALETLASLRSGYATDEFIIDSRSSLMESKQAELDRLVASYQEIDPVRLSAELDRNQLLQQYALAAIASTYGSQQSLVNLLFPPN